METIMANLQAITAGNLLLIFRWPLSFLAFCVHYMRSITMDYIWGIIDRIGCVRRLLLHPHYNLTQIACIAYRHSPRLPTGLRHRPMYSIYHAQRITHGRGYPRTLSSVHSSPSSTAVHPQNYAEYTTKS